MKKKILSFVLALCLIIPGIALLSACNNNSPVGTYTVSSVTMNVALLPGETDVRTFTLDDYNTMKQQYEQNPPENIEDEFLLSNLEDIFNVKLTIYEDGNFVIYLGYTQAGTWALNGDTLITIITTEDGEHVERLTYSNNTITMLTAGDTKTVFVKNA